MDQAEIELWFEAVDARGEYEYQEKLGVDSLTSRHDKAAVDARAAATRASEYRWHDNLRVPVDLRRLRK